MLLAALIAALMLLGVLVVLVAWGVGRARGAGRPRRPSARWAERRDLRALRVKGPERGRVILGRHERQLVAAEPRASVMVVAPAQTGKTVGLAVPAILEWDGPVLATSVKGDLTHDTLAARASLTRRARPGCRRRRGRRWPRRRAGRARAAPPRC